MTDEALVHVERLLADTYRREIEQEENIWRSLPFFAATLALELAALFQVVDRLPPATTLAGQVSLGLLAAAALASFVALGFLAAAIFPAKFRYIAADTELLTYAETLMAIEASPLPGAPQAAAASELRVTLAEQYADATDHNRALNRRRELRRSVAGMATIAAILLTLLLVAATFAHYVAAHALEGVPHGRS